MEISIGKNLQGYLSLDEINQVFSHYSKLNGFSLKTIGHSEKGAPIELLTFARPNQDCSTSSCKTSNSVLLFGGEDASEPVFSQTIPWLLRELANENSEIHKFKTSWHFISCLNPDGYQKNSGWLEHAGDLEKFFNNSWEDVHNRMIFWKTEERSEHRALQAAIDLTNPTLIYNMHDESHFPAEGYKMAFSQPLSEAQLKPHLTNIEKCMDISKDELIITDSYGHDKSFSVYPAWQKNPNTFIFINEACGYRLSQTSPVKLFVKNDHQVYKALKKYKKLQEENLSEELESSLFHTRLLISAIESGEEFNAKMLAITGYGLKHLQSLGIDEAQEIEAVCKDFILSNFKDTYKPVPVWQQVFAQLDFLFTIFSLKEV